MIELYLCALLFAFTAGVTLLRTIHAWVVLRRGSKVTSDGGKAGAQAAADSTSESASDSFDAASTERQQRRRQRGQKNIFSAAASSDGIKRVRPIKSLQMTSVAACWCFSVGIAANMASKVALAFDELHGTYSSSLSLLIVSQVSGFLGNLSLTLWFLLRERSLYCPLFATSKHALRAFVVCVTVNGAAILVILLLGLRTWTNTSHSIGDDGSDDDGISAEAQVVVVAIAAYRALQVPINILAAYIFTRPFVGKGVALSGSPVLQELLGRTAAGLLLYVGSWAAYYVWFYTTKDLREGGVAVQGRDKFAEAIFPCFVFTCRAAAICVSHRDDVPPCRACALLCTAKARHEDDKVALPTTAKSLVFFRRGERGAASPAPEQQKLRPLADDGTSAATSGHINAPSPSAGGESGDGLRSSVSESTAEAATFLRKSMHDARKSLHAMAEAMLELDDEEEEEVDNATNSSNSHGGTHGSESMIAARHHAENPMVLTSESNNL